MYAAIAELQPIYDSDAGSNTYANDLIEDRLISDFWWPERASISQRTQAGGILWIRRLRKSFRKANIIDKVKSV